MHLRPPPTPNRSLRLCLFLMLFRFTISKHWNVLFFFSLPSPNAIEHLDNFPSSSSPSPCLSGPPPHVHLVPLPMFIWSPPHSHQFSSPNLSVSLPAFLIDQIHFSATISSRISTSSLRSPSALGTWNTITFKDGFKISIYRFTMVFKGISAMHF